MNNLSERLAAALADGYRLERELGAGSMATVYLAEDLKHQRKVAVKVLRADLAASLGPERFPPRNHDRCQPAAPAGLTLPRPVPASAPGRALPDRVQRAQGGAVRRD